jgi:hypothetical protein
MVKSVDAGTSGGNDAYVAESDVGFQRGRGAGSFDDQDGFDTDEELGFPQYQHRDLPPTVLASRAAASQWAPPIPPAPSQWVPVEVQGSRQPRAGLEVPPADAEAAAAIFWRERPRDAPTSRQEARARFERLNRLSHQSSVTIPGIPVSNISMADIIFGESEESDGYSDEEDYSDGEDLRKIQHQRRVSMEQMEVYCPDFTCDDESPMQCSICLDDCELGQRVRKVLACGHQFHSECLDVWLDRRGSCPNCRNGVAINERCR